MTMHTIDAIYGHVTGAVSKAFVRVFGSAPVTPVTLTYPPMQRNDPWLGDFAVACFPFAREFRAKPADIASRLAASLNADACIGQISPVGPYLNITIRPEVLFPAACREAISQGISYGTTSEYGGDKRVMVEYLSPNTNKPLHLGHVRNGALGMAVSNIIAATGRTVVKANLINDRGIHICKSMIAYELWGASRTPESMGVKGDHFVGDFYVMFEQEFEREWQAHLEGYPAIRALPDKQRDAKRKEFFGQSVIGAKAQKMLSDWEAEDPGVRALWERMNQWVYAGFGETYERYGFRFDAFYYESNTYLLGRDIVQSGLAHETLTKLEDGSVAAYLPVAQFGTDKGGAQKRTTLLRQDGTSLYMTQDIGTAVRKFEDHELDVSVYVVANEQDHHFQALFAILGMLGYQWFSNCHHLSYGMVNLPDGRMKSREGKVVDADDLLTDMAELVEEFIRKQEAGATSDPLPQTVLAERAFKIALAAIKFYLLRVAPTQTMTFDPVQSLSLQGDTGPYCQYAYARCASILRRAPERVDMSMNADWTEIGNEHERYLVRCITILPETVQRAAEQMDPSVVAGYVHELARAFNQFYQQCRILDREIPVATVRARVELVAATAVALKQGLTLLGIDALDEM